MGKMNKSEIEERTAFQLRAMKAPPFEREYRFHPARRWRFDFAWPALKLAVEVEGGIWTGGAHSRGEHFNSDCSKYNEAGLMGWFVLRVTTNHIESGEAYHWIQRALRLKAGKT